MFKTIKKNYVLKLLNNWNSLTASQVKELCGFNHLETTRQCLSRLEKTGYVKSVGLSGERIRLYNITLKGLKSLNLPRDKNRKLPYTTSRGFNFAAINHNNKLIKVLKWMLTPEQIYNQEYLTARQINTEWTKINLIENLRDEYQTIFIKRIPDLMVIKNNKKIAIEVEISKKHPHIMRDILLTWRYTGIEAKQYDELYLFCNKQTMNSWNKVIMDEAMENKGEYYFIHLYDVDSNGAKLPAHLDYDMF